MVHPVSVTRGIVATSTPGSYLEGQNETGPLGVSVYRHSRSLLAALATLSHLVLDLADRLEACCFFRQPVSQIRLVAKFADNSSSKGNIVFRWLPNFVHFGE